MPRADGGSGTHEPFGRARVRGPDRLNSQLRPDPPRSTGRAFRQETPATGATVTTTQELPLLTNIACPRLPPRL